jgi:Zincin-like metallopeptidase
MPHAEINVPGLILVGRFSSDPHWPVLGDPEVTVTSVARAGAMRLQARRTRYRVGISFPMCRSRTAPLHQEPREENAAYIATWLGVLKNDNRTIFAAAASEQPITSTRKPPLYTPTHDCPPNADRAICMRRSRGLKISGSQLFNQHIPGDVTSAVPWQTAWMAIV